MPQERSATKGCICCFSLNVGEKFRETFFEVVVGCSHNSLFRKNENVKVSDSFNFFQVKPNDFINLTSNPIADHGATFDFGAYNGAEAVMIEFVFTETCDQKTTCGHVPGFENLRNIVRFRETVASSKHGTI